MMTGMLHYGSDDDHCVLAQQTVTQKGVAMNLTENFNLIKHSSQPNVKNIQ